MTAWRLIFLTLPLDIDLIALLAGTWLALPWAFALLLGAVLAPTDPVLASDVQVGPPKTGEEDEVRSALTSEAGVNDGAEFPFVHLAIALAASSMTGEPWLGEWLNGIVSEASSPRVIGINDWAWKKGHQYGSILCDLERRNMIDLLLDREPATVEAWPAGRPSVEIVSRDRGGLC